MKKILISMLVLLSVNARADMFTPNHNCMKPFKPYSFNSDYDVQRFKREVENYKNCIENFLEKQNREIENHISAKEKAIEEYNNYVIYELK